MATSNPTRIYTTLTDVTFLDWWQGGGYATEAGPVEGPPNIGKYVATDAVAFRNGPSSEIRLVAILPAGTVVATDGRELYGWWGVVYGDTAGWIYGRYLKPQQ